MPKMKQGYTPSLVERGAELVSLGHPVALYNDEMCVEVNRPMTRGGQGEFLTLKQGPAVVRVPVELVPQLAELLTALEDVDVVELVASGLARGAAGKP